MVENRDYPFNNIAMPTEHMNSVSPCLRPESLTIEWNVASSRTPPLFRHASAQTIVRHFAKDEGIWERHGKLIVYDLCRFSTENDLSVLASDYRYLHTLNPLILHKMQSIS